MIKTANLQQIGQFLKPHGVKGELSLLTDLDMDDMAGDLYIVCNMDGLWVPFFIESYRPKNNSTMLITFEHLDSEDKVKFLSGKTAFIPAELLPPAGTYPDQERSMIGYTIMDERIGRLGQIIDIDDSTLNILLTVDYCGKEILIPQALVKSIQHDQKTMNLFLPEGFLDI